MLSRYRKNGLSSATGKQFCGMAVAQAVEVDTIFGYVLPIFSTKLVEAHDAARIVVRPLTLTL